MKIFGIDFFLPEVELKCKTCRFWHRVSSEQKGIVKDYGICWRYPETVVKKPHKHCGEFSEARQT